MSGLNIFNVLDICSAFLINFPCVEFPEPVLSCSRNESLLGANSIIRWLPAEQFDP